MSVLMPPNETFENLILQALLELGATNGNTATRKEATTKGIELGKFSKEQLAVPPPSRNTANLGSLVEFKLSFSFSNLKDAGWVTNPARGQWTLLEGGERKARRLLAK